MRRSRSGRPATGVSLVELLTVLLVASLLAAFALPRYQEHLRAGRRAEARTGLMRAAQWLERHATERGRYPEDAAALPARMAHVPSGAYRIAFLPGGSAGSGYTLTALPQGPQAADRCGAFTLAHTGLQGLAARGASPRLVAECWNR